jgi:hypothetical protein
MYDAEEGRKERRQAHAAEMAARADARKEAQLRFNMMVDQKNQAVKDRQDKQDELQYNKHIDRSKATFKDNFKLMAAPKIGEAEEAIAKLDSAILGLDGNSREKLEAQSQINQAIRQYAKALNSGTLTEQDVTQIDARLLGSWGAQAESWVREKAGLVARKENIEAFRNTLVNSLGRMKMRASEHIKAAVANQKMQVDQGLISPDMAAGAIAQLGMTLGTPYVLDDISKGVDMLSREADKRGKLAPRTIIGANKQMTANAPQPAQAPLVPPGVVLEQLEAARAAKLAEKGQK